MAAHAKHGLAAHVLAPARARAATVIVIANACMCVVIPKIFSGAALRAPGPRGSHPSPKPQSMSWLNPFLI